MFVPLEANWAAGWAPVALLADSCPALEDIHLPGGFRVVGNCLGVQEVIGQEYTSPFSWRHELEWPVMKPPRTVARTGIPWSWRSPGASWPLCPHQWEAWSGLQVSNGQWCPPCWLAVHQPNRQVLHRANLSSPHVSRLPSSSGSSWGAGWGSHWLSPYPWKKARSQTRVGTERKGSPMRYRKIGLSTWMETPNGIWILSQGSLEFCCHLPQEGMCSQLQFQTTCTRAKGEPMEGTLSMLHPDSLGSLSPFLCAALLSSLCFCPLLEFRPFK